ncbi:uncharacterized protein [Venturia canescens]|uniref:uncharacterized protein n=1 Tax=Venturia canescens TaxID=32260 RepID=UPI001C9D0A4B|nr:uncharacterized protein LOC122407957 [Venturia canescens]
MTSNEDGGSPMTDTTAGSPMRRKPPGPWRLSGQWITGTTLSCLSATPCRELPGASKLLYEARWEDTVVREWRKLRGEARRGISCSSNGGCQRGWTACRGCRARERARWGVVVGGGENMCQDGRSHVAYTTSELS